MKDQKLDPGVINMKDYFDDDGQPLFEVQEFTDTGKIQHAYWLDDDVELNDTEVATLEDKHNIWLWYELQSRKVR